MKKNWIIWKRTLAASLCELFCPVVLMAILAIARLLVDKETVAAQSNLTKATLFYPIDHYSASNSTSATVQAHANLKPFLDFSNITIDKTNAVYNFFPQGCKQLKRDDPRTVIAYSGDQAIT
jgi:hypothetical protein